MSGTEQPSCVVNIYECPDIRNISQEPEQSTVWSREKTGNVHGLVVHAWSSDEADAGPLNRSSSAKSVQKSRKFSSSKTKRIHGLDGFPLLDKQSSCATRINGIDMGTLPRDSHPGRPPGIANGLDPEGNLPQGIPSGMVSPCGAEGFNRLESASAGSHAGEVTHLFPRNCLKRRRFCHQDLNREEPPNGSRCSQQSGSKTPMQRRLRQRTESRVHSF